MLVRGGFYGKGKIGDENCICLCDVVVKVFEIVLCWMVLVYVDFVFNECCYGDL